ncbi:MAG TPA: regulatory protein RecX [Oryzihumus sp.]|nr:regulatory protein RecX [Oryzihumus sp.]
MTTDKHDAARAALEAALAATSGASGGPAPAWSDPRLGTSGPDWARGPAGDRDPEPAEGPGRRATGRAQGRTTRRVSGKATDGRGRPRRSRQGPATPGDPEQDLQARDAAADPYDVARQIVLRQLAMAPRSRQQLEDKLRQRNCPDDVATAVLDRMTEVGLVDDAAYAQMLVRSKQAERGLARRALAQELRTKGIDPELAAETLDDIDEETERARARQLVDKKLRTMHGLGVEVQTRRLAGMLARKGYSSGMSYAVIRDAIADSEEYLTD